jgi:signal transduction histidine kinase
MRGVAETRDHRALRAALAGAWEVLSASPLASPLTESDRVAAERSAEMLLRSGGAAGEACLAFAAELLAGIPRELSGDRDGARTLIDRLAVHADLAPVSLGRELLRATGVLGLDAETALALVLIFTGAESAALFDGEAAPVARVGEARGEELTIPVDGSPAGGVIAVSGVSAEDPVAGAVLAAAEPLLRSLLQRHRRSAAGEPGDASGAVQRRLARLRFDLHDGPQQDIHLLSEDLRLFRDQLRPMLDGDPDQDRALGRLDDLEAQLVVLDGDLRRLVMTVESPFLTPSSLHDALTGLTQAFAERTGVMPETSLTGSPSSLSDSQQIALLSLVREALSNIRRHSDAQRVQIAIETGEDGIGVRVTDDGSGFDPEPTLARAAQAGRLGLVGMHERVRMLGGSTQIRSRPGGPTVVSASLPAWSGE